MSCGQEENVLEKIKTGTDVLKGRTTIESFLDAIHHDLVMLTLTDEDGSHDRAEDSLRRVLDMLGYYLQRRPAMYSMEELTRFRVGIADIFMTNAGLFCLKDLPPVKRAPLMVECMLSTIGNARSALEQEARRKE